MVFTVRLNQKNLNFLSFYTHLHSSEVIVKKITTAFFYGHNLVSYSVNIIFSTEIICTGVNLLLINS